MTKEGIVTKPFQDAIMQLFVKSNPLIVTYASNAVMEKWEKLRISISDGDYI